MKLSVDRVEKVQNRSRRRQQSFTERLSQLAGDEPAARTSGQLFLLCMQNDEPMQMSRYASDYRYNFSVVYFSIKCSN